MQEYDARCHFARFQALDLEEASLGTAASLGKYFDNATYGKIAGEKSPQPPSSHKRSAKLRDQGSLARQNANLGGTLISHSQL